MLIPQRVLNKMRNWKTTQCSSSYKKLRSNSQSED